MTGRYRVVTDVITFNTFFFFRFVACPFYYYFIRNNNNRSDEIITGPVIYFFGTDHTQQSPGRERPYSAESKYIRGVYELIGGRVGRNVAIGKKNP